MDSWRNSALLDELSRAFMNAPQTGRRWTQLRQSASVKERPSCRGRPLAEPRRLRRDAAASATRLPGNASGEKQLSDVRLSKAHADWVASPVIDGQELLKTLAQQVSGAFNAEKTAVTLKAFKRRAFPHSNATEFNRGNLKG